MKHLPMFRWMAGWILATATGGAVIAQGQRAEAPAPLLPIATGSGVLFRCRAPSVGAVYLTGSFNHFAGNNEGRITNETFRMTGPDADGIFSKVVHLEPGLHRFQFAMDGIAGRWFLPPEIEERDADGNGILRVGDDGHVAIRTSIHPDWAPRATPQGVTFRFYRQGAHIVYLAGEFNHWADNDNGLVTDPGFAMHGPDEEGAWTATVLLPSGAHAYQFVVDGDRWVADPNAARRDPANHSIVEVP